MQIFQKCQKLERLHLEGEKCDEMSFLMNLAEYLPTATNLRDLRYIFSRNLKLTTSILLKHLSLINRLTWKFLKISPAELLPVLNALKCCPKFERLGLLVENEGSCYSFNYYAPLENALLTFVKEMPHLVALCLAGLSIDCNGVVNRQLIEETTPERPAFWCHLSRNLPRANEVPKIHYEEIVHPIKQWYSLPRL